MSLEEWNQLCRKAWKNDENFIQIEKLAILGEGRYTFTIGSKTTCLECTPQTKPF